MARYTSQQAAELLGVSDAHVRHLATSMGMQRQGRDWWFSPADIRAFKRRPDARSEPPDLLPATPPAPPPRRKKRK